MTELEARALKLGEIVVGRRPGQMGVLQQVQGIDDRDFLPADAMRILHIEDEEEARRFAFDGPIIYTVDAQRHRLIWRAPYISRPRVECTFTCCICLKDVEVQIGLAGYKKYREGWRPSSVCFPEEPLVLTSFLHSRVCRQCNPYYRGPLMLLEVDGES
jgi:hypothetical protein